MLEKTKLENILRLLRRGKWELEGEEVLAFYQCFDYLTKVLKDMKLAEEQQKIASSAKVVESPITIDQQPKIKRSKKKDSGNS